MFVSIYIKTITYGKSHTHTHMIDIALSRHRWDDCELYVKKGVIKNWYMKKSVSECGGEQNDIRKKMWRVVFTNGNK